MFEMYEDEFIDDEVQEGGDNVLFTNQSEIEKRLADLPEEDDDEFREIEEEPNIVTIKTLSPNSDQLKSLNLQPGENLITFSVKSRLQGQ